MAQVGIVYYPEGQGHATRMLGIAQALERRGVEVRFAGGGPGTRFVEMHGHDVHRVTPVDFVADYQYRSPALLAVVTRSLPSGGRRIADLVRWFRGCTLDCVVTDDMFAVAAASLARITCYVVTHNAPSLYDRYLERGATWGINRFQALRSERFFYPAVWPPTDGDPVRVQRIDPIALEGHDGSQTPVDGGILVVPSFYSTGFDELADSLRRAGYSVTDIGSEGWESVPALLPWIRAADLVVCSGYSTVMEAAVAGTPCIVWPFTDEQRGIARKLETTEVDGFGVARSVDEVIAVVERPPTAPTFENGIETVAERVVADRSVAREPLPERSVKPGGPV